MDEIQVFPATAERWADLEQLFGKTGASAGCWCMWWRLPRAEFKARRGDGNRETLRGLVEAGAEPGVLAYHNGQAIGWCSIGPRQHYAALESSRILKRVDDRPVWSIVCFFVHRRQRRKGVALHLLRGALAYAFSHGAQIVEAYPLDLQTPRLDGKQMGNFSGYMGLSPIFRELGFQEVARASDTQIIMRWSVPTD